MSDYCCFDRLPVELLHSLFNYFSAHEILHTFSHVSDYVEKVLRSYSAYRLNCKAIGRSDFDRLCHRIHPEQVISLTLSDENDTPGQSQLFLSRFRIDQFTQLRSLTLIQLEIETLKLICSGLYQLRQLHSLSIIPESNGHIQHQFINPHLRHLKLGICSKDELEIILQHQLQLKSLDVHLKMKQSKFDFHLPCNQLIRLSLKIEHCLISMAEMEQFLPQLPYLKHLELKIDGLRDLFDGYRWQILTKSFLTFNFLFTAQHVLTENILKSFSTSFWLEEKHWFVAYEDYSLFSIPHFAPDYIDISQPSRIRSTAPNHTLLYKQVKKITMKTAAIKHYQSFNHIQTLELRCSVSLKTVLSIVNLNHLRHLTVLSFDDVFKFIPLQDRMPHLRELAIEKDVTLDLIERIDGCRFEQIHQLEISVSDKQSEYLIERLSRLFPCVHHLIYKSPIQSKDTIVRVIIRFKYLTNASFFTDLWFYRKEYRFCRSPYSIAPYSRRLTKNQFTCRVDGRCANDLVNTQLWIHFWIGDEVSHFDQAI